jgi:nucleoside-triphosphatase THEP1
LLPSHISLKILLRSFIIVLSWYFIIGPLLKKLLNYWLQKKKSKSQQDIQQVLQLLPATQQLIAQSWRRTSDKKRWKRIAACCKLILVNALNPANAGKVFILTGPIQTGKTTSLAKWSENRNDVFGIMTPVVNGKRMFMNVHARHLFDMEATDGETQAISVGRFTFSKTNFNKAIQIIRSSMDKEGWLMIDEIGPLELRGEGFCEVLKEVLQNEKTGQMILVVVRNEMAGMVKEFFQLNDAVVINKISELG